MMRVGKHREELTSSRKGKKAATENANRSECMEKSLGSNDG